MKMPKSKAQTPQPSKTRLRQLKKPPSCMSAPQSRKKVSFLSKDENDDEEIKDIKKMKDLFNEDADVDIKDSDDDGISSEEEEEEVVRVTRSGRKQTSIIKERTPARKKALKESTPATKKSESTPAKKKDLHESTPATKGGSSPTKKNGLVRSTPATKKGLKEVTPVTKKSEPTPQKKDSDESTPAKKCLSSPVKKNDQTESTPSTKKSKSTPAKNKDLLDSTPATKKNSKDKTPGAKNVNTPALKNGLSISNDSQKTPATKDIIQTPQNKVSSTSKKSATKPSKSLDTGAFEKQIIPHKRKTSDEDDSDSDLSDSDSETEKMLGFVSKTSNKQDKTPITKKQSKESTPTAQKSIQDSEPPKKKKKKSIEPTKSSSLVTDSSAKQISPQKRKASDIDSPDSGISIDQDLERKRERDRRTLFIKNLVPQTTAADIRSLSKDIKDVRVRTLIKRNKTWCTGYAFLEFQNEMMAELNYKHLQGKTLHDNVIFLDYVGEKSANQEMKKKKNDGPDEIDPYKLYVAGFKEDTKESDLLKLFPTASDCFLPIKKKDQICIGYALLKFDSPEKAKSAHDKMQGKFLNDRSLIVLHGKKKKDSKEHKETTKKPKLELPKNVAGKKTVVESEEEDESDDDDEDIDDSEDDDDIDDSEEDINDSDDDEDDDDEDEIDDSEDDDDDDDEIEDD